MGKYNLVGSHCRSQDRQVSGPGFAGVVYINCTLTVTECDVPRTSHVVGAMEGPYAPPQSTLDNVVYDYTADSCSFRYGFAYPDLSGQDEWALNECLKIMMTMLFTYLRNIWAECGYPELSHVGPEPYALTVTD